jgi:hypothetical protein
MHRFSLAIHVAPMSDGYDVNAVSGIVDGVENPVVAHANSVGLLTMEFLYADRPGILFEAEQLSPDALKDRPSKLIEFALS